MYGKFRGFLLWACCHAFVVVGALQAVDVQAQTHNRYIQNDAATTKYWRLEYKSDASGPSWISIASGSRLAGQNLLLDSTLLNCVPTYPGAMYQVEWYTGSIGAVGAGETTGSWRLDAGSWNSGAYQLACGGSGTVDLTYRYSGAPPPEWCFRVKIDNRTAAFMAYDIYFVTNSGGRAFVGTSYVSPGGNYQIQVGPKAGRYERSPGDLTKHGYGGRVHPGEVPLHAAPASIRRGRPAI